MGSVRIIPRLDIKGPNLVKGIHLEGLRALGNPEEFAKAYYLGGADELIYQDVVASLYERNSLLPFIKKVAENIFIPLTVGGGIRSLSDIYNALRSGADKVTINTAAIKNPNFLKEAVKDFGSSTIVIAIEAIKTDKGEYNCFTDNGREYTDIDVFDWASKVEDMGVGELIVTSIDREGTGKGFDLELISKIASKVKIPVVAHGGAGNIAHIRELIDNTDISGVAISSMLHYYLIKQVTISSENIEQEGNFAFLKGERDSFSQEVYSIAELKKQLNTTKNRIRI